MAVKMIKLMLVEDEPPIARAVKTMIERASASFEITSCEINGLAALERLAVEPVDVIMTDIRMPVMDGLEFLSHVKELYPDCITVILSGYQEFSYAQTAIKLGAFDYLLKPLTLDKLSELLDRIKDIHALSAVVRKKNLLRKSIQGALSASTEHPSKCSVLVACAGAWPLSPDDEMMPGAVFWNKTPFEYSQLICDGEEVIEFEGKVKTERIFVFDGMDAERFAEASRHLYNRLIESAKPLAVTVCAYPEPTEVWEVGYLIRALRARLYTCLSLCRSQFIWDVGGEEYPVLPTSELSVENIVEAMFTKDRRSLETAVKSLVMATAEKGIRQIEFCRLLDAVVCDRRLQIPLSSGIKLDLNEAISNATAFGGLAADIFAILDHFGSYENKGEQRDIIWRIEKYLEQNLNKTITNEALSKRFGFVPSYISKLFRRHKGMSPSEYVTMLRVEKAKEAMSRNSGILIREVSLLVGYDDPYYFSKIFKKKTGLWPKQYQDSLKP